MKLKSGNSVLFIFDNPVPHKEIKPFLLTLIYAAIVLIPISSRLNLASMKSPGEVNYLVGRM